MILGSDLKPSLDDLTHHGVKGMHWGIRHDPRATESNRQRLHRLNAESRAKDRAAREAARRQRNILIDQARVRVRSGQSAQDLKDAKAQFKTEKKTIGSREARKKLNAARLQNSNDVETSRLIKNGAETAGAVIGIIGGIGLSLFLQSAHRA